jgi:flagellar hook protein FlgE
MSLFSTLRTGASGLGVASLDLSVIGDNIANIGTVGYKQSRATFADFMPQDVYGLGGKSQLGMGAATNHVDVLFGQGSIEPSGLASDMAINGNGLFIVADGNSRYYTRAGNFSEDDDGYLNLGGLRLQGYNATDGNLSSVVGDLQIDHAAVPGQETSTITLQAQLDSAADFTTTPLAAMAFYGTGAGGSTLADAASAADFATSVTMYDSLGSPHAATILFERTGASTWSWHAVTDATQVYDATGAPVSTTEGEGFEMANGTLTFDTDGNLTSVGTPTTATGWAFSGSAEPVLTFDFGLDAAGNVTDGALTTQGGESSVSAITQDGAATGNLNSWYVDTDGQVRGEYTNGDERVLGQVVLASFLATDGLQRVGQSMFAATAAAGQPVVGAPDSGGFGSVAGYALEKSNVELEDQFVLMISAQREYQANSKVISTAADTLSSLLQIV